MLKAIMDRESKRKTEEKKEETCQQAGGSVEGVGDGKSFKQEQPKKME